MPLDISKFSFGDKRKELNNLASIAEQAERYDDMCQFMRELVISLDKKDDLNVSERNLLSVAYKNNIGARRASWRTLNNLASIAEQAERYDDMCQFMRELVISLDKKDDLNVSERNLLSVAYKNNIGARRASWRTLNMDDSKDDAKVSAYRTQVEAELEKMCQEVLDLLENYLVPFVKDKRDEATVFYLKMTGDYYRYLAEFVSSKGYDGKASSNYDEAMDVAMEKLPPTHPIRLGLALNFSVCKYEILKDQKGACAMAKSAFDDAIAKLDQLDENSYKDSTLIMQLLRDNLTLWTSENEDADEDA